MANRFDVKTKTFFQIPPKTDSSKRYYGDADRVVFMDHGFSLGEIHLITEPVMVRDLQYTFDVGLCYSSEKIITFEFKRKQDCIMAQRELTRAWTRTGEFKYEDIQTGEGTSPE